MPGSRRTAKSYAFGTCLVSFAFIDLPVPPDGVTA
jgi:hypothetical protein